MNLIKSSLKKIIGRFGFEVVRKGSLPADQRRIRSDFRPEDLHTIKSVESHTQTSPERLLALIRAVEYTVKHQIPGDIVECGVWKGGSMMAIAKTLIQLGVTDRELYLYDTFDGMSPPTGNDVSLWGVNAKEEFQKFHEDNDDETDLFKMNIVPLDEVKTAVFSVGYDKKRFHFVKGKVEETIPGIIPNSIAILRLDTDWYSSTRHEMEHLFPRLSPGGVLIIDDYGEWQGARAAVDEYIKKNKLKILLNRIDYTGRIAVKTR